MYSMLCAVEYESESACGPLHSSNHHTIRMHRRMKVSLALHVYDFSVAVALEMAGDPSGMQTAVILRIIRVWWEIMNVKASNKGFHQRLECAYPWTLGNLLERRAFLLEFIRWLDVWERSARGPGKRNKKGALSADTFFALRQSSAATVCVR